MENLRIFPVTLLKLSLMKHYLSSQNKKRRKVLSFALYGSGLRIVHLWLLKKIVLKFNGLDEASANHYAELKAMDRSIGSLRKGLRKLSIEKNTIIWFMSDNGGLPKINPTTTGGLRNFKGSLYEGGIRVPCIIEWPNGIPAPRSTNYPAGAVDVFPTISEIVGLHEDSCIYPQDGESLFKIFKKEKNKEKPLIFSSNNRMAVIDNNWKLFSLPSKNNPNFELYNLSKDISETTNLKRVNDKIFKELNKLIEVNRVSIQKSVEGKDYKEGFVKNQPPRIFWTEVEEYKKYFNHWKFRPEYESRLKNK